MGGDLSTLVSDKKGLLGYKKIYGSYDLQNYSYIGTQTIDTFVAENSGIVTGTVMISTIPNTTPSMANANIEIYVSLDNGQTVMTGTSYSRTDKLKPSNLVSSFTFPIKKGTSFGLYFRCVYNGSNGNPGGFQAGSLGPLCDSATKCVCIDIPINSRIPGKLIVNWYPI
jgi:hypothetical protein